MNCPYCGEELGLNNTCINPICSHFSQEINNNETTHAKIDSTTYSSIDNDCNQNSNNESNYSNASNTSNQNSNFNNKNTNNSNVNKGPDISDISDEEFLAFFGDENSEFYLKHLNSYRLNKKFTSWNWPCFFFTFYWFAYRNLYALAFGILAIKIMACSLGPVSLILRIVLGFYANCIYINSAEKRIRAIRAANPTLTKDEYLMKIRSEGGCNILALFIFIGLVIIILSIFCLSAYLLFSFMF